MFDGDEMNLHVPQSIVTEHELRSIAAVPYQIMSPKECKPLVAVVQDVALGIYRLTKKHVFLNEKQLFNLLSTNTKFMGDIPKPVIEDGRLIRKWSGSQALSAIIPANVNMRSANKSYDETIDDKDNFVVIENGELKQGVVDKDIYQKRTKGLIHSIYNDAGEQETRHFFDNTQKLICNWLVYSGFSVGISDLIVDETTQQNLKSTINNMKVQVYDIIRDIHMDKFENLSINDNNDYFETEINKILNKAREATGKLGLSKINDIENRLINMIKSGSKGSSTNVAQMIACVGQQNVDGKRIAYGFDNRTLPHFMKYDDGPDSRGFVENSFISGLSPQEFFFHSMGGREGLIDTAVKTSETGYLQRKLVKAMEDCKIAYDYTVRNASGSIIQFLYGEDGMNPIKIESQSLPYINMSLQDMYKDYMLSQDYIKHCALLHPDVVDDLEKDDKWEAEMKQYFDQVLKDREYMIVDVFEKKQETTFMYPVSFTRIINNAKAMLKKHGIVALSDLNPKYVLKSIRTLCEELYVSRNNAGNKFLQILVRCHLSPKQVMTNYRFTKDIFDHVVQQIKLRFFEAIASPSEMVGVVAAQSIGEPATQLSCLRTSKVLISTKDKSKTFYCNMGDFIDTMLKQNKDQVLDLGNDSVVFDPTEDYYIVGVSDKETTSWRRILQVSRHPAHGGMVRVHTKSGKTTCATLSHSFLKRTMDSIVPVKGSELKVGDRIPVAKSIPEVKDALVEVDGFKLDKELGWFIGMYLADGNVNYHTVCISKIIPEVIEKVKAFATDVFGVDAKTKTKEGTINGCSKTYTSSTTLFNHKAFAQFLVKHFGTGSYKKTLPGWVYTSNVEFIKGVISGYFDGDGNVAHGVGKGMIRAHSVNEGLIDGMIMLLAYAGIFASKTVESHNDGRQNPRLFSIQISRKYAQTFYDDIGLVVNTKRDSLEQVIAYMDREDAHNQQEYIDKIPELGEVIAFVGKQLELPGQSRTYGRWRKKEAIGRSTLINYIERFEEANSVKKDASVETAINILKQAAHSDVVWDEITHMEYLDDPMEYVYDFTVPGNDSFMVDCGVLVHNTLNSVEWNTEMLLKVGDKLERVHIGDFIDTIVDKADTQHTEKHANDTTLVWIKEKNVQVLSCDEKGRITWENVEAVTQHPPINKDGTNTLLKVNLQSGRSVIATKAKSFLKRHNNKIVEINGDELKEGDFLPVSSVLPIPEAIEMEYLDIDMYLPKDEFLYVSEAEKAIQAHKQGGQWWKNGQGSGFTVPYSSPDAFSHVFIKNRLTQQFDSGCVYPKKCKNTTSSIPESMPLDNLFGFIIGAYTAEGCATPHHLLISNNSEVFNSRVDEFAKKYNIGYHIDHRVTSHGTTNTIRMHSLVLTQLMSRMIGNGSENKRLPAWTFQAPTEFVNGVIDGYFSGDGTVTKQPRNVISATSTSQGLMEDIRQLLLKFNIISTIGLHDTPKYESKRGNFKTTKMAYKLTISCGNTKRFAEMFSLCIGKKQERLNDLCNTQTVYSRGRFDIVPDIITKTYGCINVHRDKLPVLLQDPKLSEHDKQIIQEAMDEEIMYDKVVSIEEFTSNRPYVYDLTVSNTKNFNIYNGLAMRDTFHHSGISSASKAVRGVPRIKELLSVTKNIKAPSMVITLKDEVKRDKMASNKVLKSVQTTLFRDIVKSSKIYFDADDFETDIEDDKLFVDTYRELAHSQLFQPPSVSPWLLRIEIDRQKLIDEGLNMLMLYNVLNDYYGETIACMFSDDNSHNLVFRIKLSEDNNADEEKDYITDLKALEKNIMDNTIIKGVKNIQKAIMTKQEGSYYNQDRMTFEKDAEWVISTSGTNMVEVMSHPGVDFTKTVSNDITEIYELLGIEAARNALYDELHTVIDSAELYVNYRHLSLLVDTMTNRGYLLSIDRHGINRVDFGPLAKCSFEETTDMLIKAGIFAEVDKINGVSANIMLGQIPPCGTGDCEVLIDEHKLLHTLMEDEETREQDQREEDEENEVCNLDKLTFDFSIDSVQLTKNHVPKNIEIRIV